MKMRIITIDDVDLYGLYRKMRAKDLSLSEVMDINAVRIIVDDIDSCYRVLGVKSVYSRK